MDASRRDSVDVTECHNDVSLSAASARRLSLGASTISRGASPTDSVDMHSVYSSETAALFARQEEVRLQTVPAFHAERRFEDALERLREVISGEADASGLLAPAASEEPARIPPGAMSLVAGLLKSRLLRSPTPGARPVAAPAQAVASAAAVEEAPALAVTGRQWAGPAASASGQPAPPARLWRVEPRVSGPHPAPAPVVGTRRRSVSASPPATPAQPSPARCSLLHPSSGAGGEASGAAEVPPTPFTAASALVRRHRTLSVSSQDDDDDGRSTASSGGSSVAAWVAAIDSEQAVAAAKAAAAATVRQAREAIARASAALAPAAATGNASERQGRAAAEDAQAPVTPPRASASPASRPAPGGVVLSTAPAAPAGPPSAPLTPARMRTILRGGAGAGEHAGGSATAGAHGGTGAPVSSAVLLPSAGAAASSQPLPLLAPAVEAALTTLHRVREEVRAALGSRDAVPSPPPFKRAAVAPVTLPLPPPRRVSFVDNTSSSTSANSSFSSWMAPAPAPAPAAASRSASRGAAWETELSFFSSSAAPAVAAPAPVATSSINVAALSQGIARALALLPTNPTVASAAAPAKPTANHAPLPPRSRRGSLASTASSSAALPRRFDLGDAEHEGQTRKVPPLPRAASSAKRVLETGGTSAGPSRAPSAGATGPRPPLKPWLDPSPGGANERVTSGLKRLPGEHGGGTPRPPRSKPKTVGR